MYPSSWLFVKGDASVRLVCPGPGNLDVCGPGSTRTRYTFTAESELQAYQMELAEAFSSGGWFLMGENYERRTGQERRRPGRNTQERRGPAREHTRSAATS
jgi:hypothetical protein